MRTGGTGDVYYGIVAESYDLWFPGTDFEDSNFYRRMIEAVPGPALEVGCGTGRLLIPYLRDGLDVEGVEPSPDMLDICREKARRHGLSPVLHQQLMHRMDLTRKYATIYIPFSTFMILPDREEAAEALRRFHAHLEAGGQLLLTTDVPSTPLESRGRKEWWLRRSGTRERDGATVLIHEADEHDIVEQVTTAHMRYEVYKDGVQIETHYHSLKQRWYGKYEMVMMLERAGFHDVFVHGGYTDAEASGEHETMVFRAWR